MPFNHNDHYHPLLLRHLPPGPGVALDVGCGTGRFARRLAAAGLTVDGVDSSGLMVEAARASGSPGPGKVKYRQADMTKEPLPIEHYDYISCVASLHHMPIEMLGVLEEALVPGGVLVVLGLARPSKIRDYALWLAAAPVNLLARVIVHAGERLNGGSEPALRAPIKETYPTMSEIRRTSRDLLPGSTVRPLLFWRYLLEYTKQP
ncbi:class I SAM-dependent methyltransferase [Amycolatopsis sp. NPDC059657]|uniref:class I SAM-dependent methyltransferase n=1 Tax=Amycolatopsis sp. NPDC059657 TaxID=3346899 RepID=UPI00366EA616